MGKVFLCFQMPKGESYVGGVASVINSYIKNKEYFSAQNYDVELFDYSNKVISRIPLTPLRTMIYGIGQLFALRKRGVIDTDIIHIHTSRKFLYLKDVLLGREISKQLHAKVVLTIHVGDIQTVHELLPRFLQKAAIRWLNKYFARVVFLSTKIKEQFVLAGLNPERCEVLYNFHDLPECDGYQKEKSEKLCCLFMGMINRDKGILDLLEATKLCLDIPVHLDICGTITDESIRARYEYLVRELGDCVTEHGYVRGEQKTELLNYADVLILPSYHEGLPLVVLEALATGCALILTPVGAMPEILDSENVVWIEPHNPQSIVKAIQLLMKNDELCSEMKNKNLQLSNRFSVASHVAALCSIYGCSSLPSDIA